MNEDSDDGGDDAALSKARRFVRTCHMCCAMDFLSGDQTRVLTLLWCPLSLILSPETGVAGRS